MTTGAEFRVGVSTVLCYFPREFEASCLKSIFDAGDCCQIAIRQLPLCSGGFGANPPTSCVKAHMPRAGRCLGSDSMDLLIFMIPDGPDNFT